MTVQAAARIVIRYYHVTQGFIEEKKNIVDMNGKYY